MSKPDPTYLFHYQPYACAFTLFNRASIALPNLLNPVAYRPKEVSQSTTYPNSAIIHFGPHFGLCCPEMGQESTMEELREDGKKTYYIINPDYTLTVREGPLPKDIALAPEEVREREDEPPDFPHLSPLAHAALYVLAMNPPSQGGATLPIIHDRMLYASEDTVLKYKAERCNEALRELVRVGLAFRCASDYEITHLGIMLLHQQRIPVPPALARVWPWTSIVVDIAPHPGVPPRKLKINWGEEDKRRAEYKRRETATELGLAFMEVMSSSEAYDLLEGVKENTDPKETTT